MDKYDGDALDVSEEIDRNGSRREWIGIIAQAMRESSAQAFEESAKMMLTSMPAKVHDKLIARAAALRSTTRGKGA